MPENPWSESWLAELQNLIGPDICQQLGIYALPDDFLLSVVVPVFNEEELLKASIERLCSVPIRKEIILVDDCSSDGSPEIIQEIIDDYTSGSNSIIDAKHGKNRGKGAALRTGFEKVSGDIVVIHDADLEYDPFDIPRLIQPIADGRADVVYGSRFVGDRPRRVLYYWHYFGNIVLTTLCNIKTNLNLTDMETCYKAFSAASLKTILPNLKQNRFGIEPEITAKIARAKLRIYEIAISYSGRTFEEGKKISWRDGFNAIWTILVS